MKVSCKVCGKQFNRFPSEIMKNIYCGSKCYNVANKERGQRIHQETMKLRQKTIKPNVNCSVCNKLIYRDLNNRVNKNAKHYYCSNKCHSLGRKGLPRPDVAKALKEQYKNGLRKALTGKDSPNYKGTTTLQLLIRRSNVYKKWVLDVFTRDNFTCQECGKRGGQLEAHHKISFNSLFNEFLNNYNEKKDLYEQMILFQKFWDLNNGITYCMKCHRCKNRHCKN